VRADAEAETWGPVELDAMQHVIRINRKGRAGVKAAAICMFAGVHVLHPRVLADVPRGKESSIIDPYVRALERGDTICGFSMRGYWSDIGTPDRYAQARRDAENRAIDLSRRLS
ncbi:MAG: hypothetical protein HZB35_04150, partial [Nitrospirae bacterium]|nr:hypothetical protein [Nitrospirota bacterium]